MPQSPQSSQITLTRRTRTSTLMRLAGELHATLQGQSSRAMARRLTEGELCIVLAAHRDALKAAEPDDVAAKTHAFGGFVANSYNARGVVNGDRVNIETLIATGETTVEAIWGPGSFRRPGGRGDWCVTRLLREGQSQGRVV